MRFDMRFRKRKTLLTLFLTITAAATSAFTVSDVFEGCRGEGRGATAARAFSVTMAGVFRAHSGRAGSSGFAKSRFRMLLEADWAELPPLYWLHWFSLSESPELPLPLSSSSSSSKSMGESANESSGEVLSTEDATATDADVAAAPDVVESAAADEEEAKPAPPAVPPPDVLSRHIMLLNDLDERWLKIESSKGG